MTLVRKSLGPRQLGWRGERNRPALLGFLERSNSPVTTQAEEEGSGYPSPEA